jgi:hypothetical protein
MANSDNKMRICDNISFDHNYDDATDYINDASPLAAGCTFVLGSGLTNAGSIIRIRLYSRERLANALAFAVGKMVDLTKNRWIRMQKR